MRYKKQLQIISLSLWALFSVDSGALEQKQPPACLAGVCLDHKAPTERALKKRFGGQSFALGYRTRGYCYKQSLDGQVAYLLFVLKNFGDGWRVVSIRAADRPICIKPTTLKRTLLLATGKGIAIRESVQTIRVAYGDPSHTLDSKSSYITEILGPKAQGVDAALLYSPLDESSNVSATVFVISADRVVAIEVTADE